MGGTVFLDSGELSPLENYALMSSVIIPRPIALVSTVSASGVQNLAPFSYFMAGGANPPSVMICPVLGNQSEPKDTLTNILATGEFVINLVDFDLKDGMNAASAALEPNESEWELTGFTPAASVFIRPPRVQQAPVSLECRLFRVVEHGDGPIASRYVIGEVAGYHVHPAQFDAERKSIRNWNPISRIGGPHYIDLAQVSPFSMKRPG